MLLWKNHHLKSKEAQKLKHRRQLNLKKKKESWQETKSKEPTIAYVDVEERTAVENNKLGAKGATIAHFVKFMNELLDIMDMDESDRGSFLVMNNNCTTHKSHTMIRKIESRGYSVMYLFPYSPELNPIE